MTDYPYMISNNKIGPIIAGIQAAAKPPKFTLEFLRNIGFTSTNDRAIVPLLKKLGFLTEDSIPTIYYDQLRESPRSKQIIAARIRDLYNELFTINTSIYNDTEANIKGAISRVTGKDETSVTRMYNTFKALCLLADFETTTMPTQNTVPDEEPPESATSKHIPTPLKTEFHYNIQIHLPATTVSVYNAIFRSLKDNLMI
jgi:hypothetical protein